MMKRSRHARSLTVAFEKPLFLLAMMVLIFPSMRRAVKTAPKGTAKDWQAFLLPVAAVVLFVIFLIAMVR